MSAADRHIPPQEAYGNIVRRLKGLGAHRKSVKVTFGLGLLACALLAVAIFALGLDALFFLSLAGRQILLALCGLALLVVLAGFVLIPLVKGPSGEQLARLTDAHFPRMRNGLVTALQLWRKREKNVEGYSTELMDAAVISTERRSRDLDLRTVVDRSGAKKVLRTGIALLGLSAVLFILFQTPLRNSAGRLSHPRTQFQRPPQTSLEVLPGDIQVTRHSDVLVRAQIGGKIPDDVLVIWKEGEARWRQDGCAHQAEREFTHLFTDLKRDILYRVSAGDAQSRSYRITVIDRPRIVKLRLRYQYPAYTGLEPQVVEEDGNISAVVGTVVGLEVEANRELAAAWLTLSGDSTQDLELSGMRAWGQLEIRESRTYAIGLRDGVGNENKDPIRYRIEAVADEPPMVQITFPAQNVDMSEEMKLPLSFVAQDDFGLSKVLLVYRIARQGEEFPEEQLSLSLPQRDIPRVEMDHLWDLAALDLIPEDLVVYKVVVSDNDRISGPKKAESKTYTVRFPSIHEILAQVQEEQTLQIVDMEEILDEERMLKERLDQIRRELENEDQVSWEQTKDVEGALERQEEIVQELAQLVDQMDKTLDRAQEQRVASTQILEKMEQVRQLMEEVATPEMRQALEDLHQALQNMDPELIKQQMDQFSLTQEDLLKRLDRTLSILKRLQAEQRLDALVKKTEEMFQRQQDILEQTREASGDQLDELGREQERLLQDTESLPEEMKDLSALMSQFPEMPSEELAQMAEQLEASQLTQQMRQAAQKLSAGSQKGAQDYQEQAAQMLQQLREGLQMLQSQMGAALSREIVEAIKGSVRDLLAISQEQEDHRSQVRRLDRDSPFFGRLAERQLSLLEAVSQVANNIYQVSQKTFFIAPQIGQAMGRALAQMDQALNALENRNGSVAAHSEKGAMVALNEAAQQLINALSSMGSSCSSGGMEALMQQLQGMTQSQMSINQQTLGLNQQGQYTMQQRAQMARLAAEQAAAQQQMEDLLKEFGNRSEILGRLDQLGEEMKEVVDDLSRRQVDQRTIERQEKILSRLLDAQKSVRRRDYTRRRRSRPGQMVLRRSPGELPDRVEEQEDQLRRDLLRALSEDYPKAYEELIRAYFQALSRRD